MPYKNTKSPDEYSGPERRRHIRDYDEDAIERLEQIVQNMPQFTAEEQVLVRQVLEAYRGWQVLGKAMKMLIVLLPFRVSWSGSDFCSEVVADSLKLPNAWHTSPGDLWDWAVQQPGARVVPDDELMIPWSAANG